MTPFDDKIHVHILTKIHFMFLHKYSFQITVNPGAYVWDHVKNVLGLGSVPLLTRASNIIRTKNIIFYSVVSKEASLFVGYMM